MTEYPRVTVGIPTYRRHAALKRCLQSLVEQEFTNFDVVISSNDCDDYATDAVVDEFREDLCIRYYKQKENIGPADNFYFVAEQATGDFFMWLGDDDQVSSGYLRELADLLAQHDGTVVAIGNCLVHYPHTTVLEPPAPVLQKSRLLRAARALVTRTDRSLMSLMPTPLARSLRFAEYPGPLNKEVLNRGYTMISQIYIHSRVLVPDRTEQYFVKDHTIPKSYSNGVSEVKSLKRKTRFVLRRLIIRIQQAKVSTRETGTAYGLIFYSLAILSFSYDIFMHTERKLLKSGK